MPEQTLTVGLVQHPCGTDMAHNLAVAIDGIRQAAQQGARLVVLQELFRSRYFCQTRSADNFGLAEPLDGPTSRQLSEIAAQTATVIVAPLFEQRGKTRYHNTALVIDADGSVAGNYRKMHIPDDPGFHEKYYFTPGDTGFAPIDTRVARLGVLICWDQWFPEAARLMALKGADLLIYPTAIGWDPADPRALKQRELDAWITVQRGHAIANSLPLLACNRCGFEPAPERNSGAGLMFWGNSFICGAQGQLLASASTREAGVLITTLDLEESRQLRDTWPFFRDRRVDAYRDLL